MTPSVGPGRGRTIKLLRSSTVSQPSRTFASPHHPALTVPRAKREVERFEGGKEMEGDGKRGANESPTGSQQTVSEDDEIDYSVKPEFYDPDLDDKDELWIEKKRNGHATDAVLSCPGCFTTLCLECQRHEKYVTQYRAIFVMNCEVMKEKAHSPSSAHPKSRKRGRGSATPDAHPAGGENLKHVHCSICSTEVGIMDEEEIYHFYNVLPSEA